MTYLIHPLTRGELEDLHGLLNDFATFIRDDDPTSPLWTTIADVGEALEDATVDEAAQPPKRLSEPRDTLERYHYQFIIAALERRPKFRISSPRDRHELARSLAACIVPQP